MDRDEELYGSIFARIAKDLEKNNCVALTPQEQQLCCGCVNENLPVFSSAERPGNLWGWMTISDETADKFKRWDICLDLLSKCNYFKRNIERHIDYGFRYRTVSCLIDDIKGSNRIYAQMYKDKIHRIAFENPTRSILIFRLAEILNFKEIEFPSVSAAQIKAYLNKADFVEISKDTAKAALQSYDPAEYPDGNIQAFCGLLIENIEVSSF